MIDNIVKDLEKAYDYRQYISEVQKTGNLSAESLRGIMLRYPDLIAQLGDKKALLRKLDKDLTELSSVTTITEEQEKFIELERASKPIIDFLNKYYDPMTIAIVTEGKVDIYQAKIGMPLEVRD